MVLTREGDRIVSLGSAPDLREACGRLRCDDPEVDPSEALGSKGGRRRAVHLAGHGLVDTARPRFSSPALSPDPENDGFLTALEILRTEFPADLVVLSACETARGKVVRSEGILGLTRALRSASGRCPTRPRGSS